jgi:hypothetical protein
MSDRHPFDYKKPTPEQVATLELMGAKFKALYDDIVATLPHNRSRSLAITNLQQARMWANAAIVLEE